MKLDQKLSQYLITEEDIGKISTVDKLLTKLDIFFIKLGGGGGGGCNFVTSSALNDDTKILTETDTEIFFPIPNFPKPKPRFFFPDQIFPKPKPILFSETKFPETKAETFFQDQIFPKPKPTLFFRDRIV